MSIFVKQDGKITTYSSFFLEESFSPVQHDYGTNLEMDNHEINYAHGDLWTFFSAGDKMFYVVFLRENTGHIGFGASDVRTVDTTAYTDDNRGGKDHALRIFNNVIFIILKLLEQYSGDTLKFEAADARLGHVYRSMMKNASFLNILEMNGWKYKGLVDDEYYTFERLTK